ncbi:hypothetical protein B0H17DRAFT_1155432 [Mycena rosella]|uniref:Protein-S-isoprenylcysteine O-methyltransferase n=1 Tax=Mycena rosella TaxID=1033263 RepID=A0AAD7H2N0_MYCRO|nr:hypothetical protein B0H17DRAFT_1155432 [Mycena rosella]
MSLLKIPLLLSIALGIHITMSPPNPAPSATEKLPPTGLERIAPRFPILLKVEKPQSAWWALNLVGGSIRLYCYRRLRTLFTFELSIRRDHHLITTGVYSVVRHPSYTGAFLAAIGIALCHLTPGTWVTECSELPPGAVVPIWVVGLSIACAGLDARMCKEDRMLRDRFRTEWDAWAARIRYKIFRCTD